MCAHEFSAVLTWFPGHDAVEAYPRGPGIADSMIFQFGSVQICFLCRFFGVLDLEAGWPMCHDCSGKRHIDDFILLRMFVLGITTTGDPDYFKFTACSLPVRWLV